MSQAVSTVPDSTNSGKRPAPEDAPADDGTEDLERMLEEAILEEQKEEVVVDVAGRYHEMIRRGMVDWGDEIIDTFIKKFGKTPKLIAHMEAVRKELIDPLRPPVV